MNLLCMYILEFQNQTKDGLLDDPWIKDSRSYHGASRLVGLDRLVRLATNTLGLEENLGGWGAPPSTGWIKSWERSSLFWWGDDLLYDVLTWRHLQLSKILFATEAGCCKAKSHSFVDVKSHTTALVCGQRVFDTLHHRVLSWPLDHNSWAFQTGWQNRKINQRLFQNSEVTFNGRQILCVVCFKFHVFVSLFCRLPAFVFKSWLALYIYIYIYIYIYVCVCVFWKKLSWPPSKENSAFFFPTRLFLGNWPKLGSWGPGFEPEVNGYPFGVDAHDVIHWWSFLVHDRGSYWILPWCPYQYEFVGSSCSLWIFAAPSSNQFLGQEFRIGWLGWQFCVRRWC